MRAQTNREIKQKAYSIREIQAHLLDQVDNQNGKTVQAGQLCTENQVRWSKPGELSKTGNRSTPKAGEKNVRKRKAKQNKQGTQT